MLVVGDLIRKSFLAYFTRFNGHFLMNRLNVAHEIGAISQCRGTVWTSVHCFFGVTQHVTLQVGNHLTTYVTQTFREIRPIKMQSTFLYLLCP